MKTEASPSSRAIQFYVVAVKWASDLDFFKIETAFFHQLLENYLKKSPALLERAGTDVEKLAILDAEIQKAQLKLAMQLRWIELMAEDVIPEDTELIAAEQIQLEKLMADLTTHFRDLKKHLFGLVEDVFTLRELSVL